MPAQPSLLFSSLRPLSSRSFHPPTFAGASVPLRKHGRCAYPIPGRAGRCGRRGRRPRAGGGEREHSRGERACRLLRNRCAGFGGARPPCRPAHRVASPQACLVVNRARYFGESAAAFGADPGGGRGWSVRRSGTRSRRVGRQPTLPPPLAHIRRATAPPAHNPRPARPPSPPYPTGRACVREAEEGSCGDSVPAAVRASALFAPTARPPAARGFAALEKTVLREITSGLFDDDDPEEAGDEDSVACLPALKATRSILRVRRSIDVEVRDQNALFFFSGWSRQTPGALPSGPACPPFCPRIAPGHPSDGESDLAVRALDGRGPGGRGGWRPQRGPDEHEKNHWRTPSLPSPLPRIADSFSPTRSR